MERHIPDPTYDREVATLVNAFKRGIADIKHELERLDLTDLKRANAQLALKEIGRILASLNEEASAWVTENIPAAALDGVARTLYALEAADTYAEARAIAKFSRLNADYVKAAVADTQADLLAVTQNVSNKVRAGVRRATAESFRANMAVGVNGRRTIQRDILDRMRKDLIGTVDNGIIDSAGRRWRPETYAEMVTRTKMARTHMEATEIEALGRGVMYGVISRHGATDACAKYEGKVVKLTADAPGDFPYVGDLKRGRDIFHPNCRHQVTPVRRPPGLTDIMESPFSSHDKAGANNAANYPSNDVASFNQLHGLSAGTDRIIRDAERHIKSLPNEVGIIFDYHGRELWRQHGDHTRLNIREAAELGLLSGNIITHNHPSNYSFSRADLGILVHFKVGEMRAVSDGYLHRVSLKPGVSYNAEDITSEYSDLLDLFEPLLSAEVKSGRMELDEANVKLYHEIVTRLAEKYKFTYTRERL